VLGDVVAAFEKTTGLRVAISRQEFAMISSPGIAGEYTAEGALQRILAGTGITYRYTASDALTLELQTLSTAIDVSTTAPGTAVSSSKYTETLREIPQTIEVIPQSILQEQGAVSLSDALRNVPGITLQAGEGGGASSTTGDMFNLRGFNASNSIFVDGVRDDGLISRNVFNLVQVEVYLGPTGSDVGRGTASGYVNMQTKTPGIRPAYSGTFSYGNSGQKRGSLDFNQPIRLGPVGSWLSRAAVRFNAFWQQGGVPGRDVVELKNRALAPAVAVGLGTPTRVFFSSQITRQDNLPDYGIPTAAWDGSTMNPAVARASQPVDTSNFYGSINYDFDDVSQENYTARVEHDASDSLTLRYQARYNQTHRDAIITGLGAFNPATETVTLQRQGNDRKNRILSNQANLVGRVSTGSFIHALSGGAEMTYEDQFAPTRTGAGTRGPVSIYNPDPNEPIVGYAPGWSGAYTKGWTNTIALYAFDTVELSRRWQLSGGIRWEHFTTNFRSVDASLVTTTDQRAADGLLSGKAGLLYRITDNGNTYFSFGTSATPPGTANFTLSAQGNNQNNPNVKPQQSRNYEVGTKWDLFRDRLLLNFAAFHTVNTNVIFTVDPTAVPPTYNQDDGQRVNGLSLGVVGQITPRLQVIANFGYLDSERITQNAAQNGLRLQLTPENSGSLWATYRLPFGVNLGGGIRYSDIAYVNATNTIIVPSYYVADALAEYTVGERVTVRFNVYNLTDKEYAQSVNNNGNRYNPGSPRSAMVTTAFRF
jgi:catecholate siderophore receptor